MLYLQAETIYEDMKKNLLWMLAAILTCGLMTTSCSSDDNPVGGWLLTKATAGADLPCYPVSGDV